MNKETEDIKNTEETAEITESAASEISEEKTETAENIPAGTDGVSAEENNENKENKGDSVKEPYTFKTFINDIFDIAETLLVFLLIFFLMKAYLFDQAIVDGTSMVPTLQNEQRLIYSKIYTPEDNDIVIADNERLGLIVKRVVAVAGQTVDVRDGKVYVDGEELDEQVYEEGAVLTASHFINTETQPRSYHNYPVTVPEGHVFIMGDNRGVSEDSRGEIVGFVPVEDIVGKVVARYYPLKDFRIFNY